MRNGDKGSVRESGSRQSRRPQRFFDDFDARKADLDG